MTLVVLLAFGCGGGILAAVHALRERRVNLATAITRLESRAQVLPEGRAARDPAGLHAGGPQGLAGQMQKPGQALAGFLVSQPSISARLSPALALSGISLEDLCTQVVAAAVAGALAVLLCWVAIGAAGIHMPLALPIWGVLLAGVAAGTIPMMELRSKVLLLRRQARQVVGSLLDLVVLAMAGGMGVESALQAASRVGDDWVSRRTERALALARDAGMTPWDALGRLGEELGVRELVELAASMGLAGQEGARVKASLAAKAASIRRHELAEAETEANTLTERLFLPGVLLLAGFLVFIGYPALSRIMSGF
jgi:Flp pilus assembly protein TadB